MTFLIDGGGGVDGGNDGGGGDDDDDDDDNDDKKRRRRRRSVGGIRETQHISTQCSKKNLQQVSETRNTK
jgi:hypothetical protein